MAVRTVCRNREKASYRGYDGAENGFVFLRENFRLSFLLKRRDCRENKVCFFRKANFFLITHIHDAR